MLERNSVSLQTAAGKSASVRPVVWRHPQPMSVSLSILAVYNVSSLAGLSNGIQLKLTPQTLTGTQ